MAECIGLSNLNFIRDNKVITKIKNKLRGCLSKDTKKFSRPGTITCDDVFELLARQKGRCYVCDDDISIKEWMPYCCYQFSLDRIDNNYPHDKNNVLLSCFYCNCRGHQDFNQIDKICNSGCHNYKRCDMPHKQNVKFSTLVNYTLNVKREPYSSVNYVAYEIEITPDEACILSKYFNIKNPIHPIDIIQSAKKISSENNELMLLSKLWENTKYVFDTYVKNLKLISLNVKKTTYHEFVCENMPKYKNIKIVADLWHIEKIKLNVTK